MKKQIGKTLEDKFRKLATDGFGDALIRQGNEQFVVFHLPSMNVYVRQFGSTYDQVEVW